MKKVTNSIEKKIDFIRLPNERKQQQAEKSNENEVKGPEELWGRNIMHLLAL